MRVAAGIDRARYVVRDDRLDLGEPLELGGQRHDRLVGALARVRVGAVGTGCQHRELDPQRPLLAEAHAERTRRLAVQERVAVHLRVVLHQIAGAIGAERLLVRDRGQGQFAFQAVLDAAEVDVGEDRGRGAALHVGDATTIDPAVDQLTAPRVFGPAKAVVGDREHVDVAIEHEVAAGRAAVETGDDVGHFRVWRDDPASKAATLEIGGQEGRHGARIAWRVGALVAHELAQERDELIAVLLDPVEQLLAVLAHCWFSSCMPDARCRLVTARTAGSSPATVDRYCGAPNRPGRCRATCPRRRPAGCGRAHAVRNPESCARA